MIRCTSPRANYQRSEIRQHLKAALAELSPEHRAVIVLKEIEDLQYQEIAEILNISIGTVMSRLFYGRKKLQFMLRPIYNQIYESQRPRTVRPHLNKRNIGQIGEEAPHYEDAPDSNHFRKNM
jgi:DNA-directed RNA polymerase specialized sigma24 family protein